MKRLYKKISTILYITICCLCIFLILFSFELTDVTRLKTPISLWYVTSSSMEPIYYENDGFILVKSKELEVGDIITFKPQLLNNPYVTHRIADITNSGSFITKGDNNLVTDQESSEPPVNMDAILGKVFTLLGKPFKISKLGTISQYLKNKTNIIKIFSILVFIVVIGYLVEVIFTKNKRIKKNKNSLKEVAPFFDFIFLIFAVLLIANALFISITVKSIGSEDFSYIVVSTKGLKSPMPNTNFKRTLGVENSSNIPFIIKLTNDHENMTIAPDTIKLDAKQKAEYQISIKSESDIGYYVKQIYKMIYPDILSENLLNNLITINEYLPLIIIFSPGIILCVVLYLIWLRRWTNHNKLVMDWLIPLRKLTS